MTGVRATVRNGRLVLDEPTSLPEGTVLDLVLDDEGDDLDHAERALRAYRQLGPRLLAALAPQTVRESGIREENQVLRQQRHFLVDRDGSSDARFRRILRDAGIKVLRTVACALDMSACARRQSPIIKPESLAG